ncbi:MULTISPECIES: hypothetical protein [Vibrio]|uniref:hypothetical protein n=1 Tax=Vibrio TaxID=662 RepID=UPI001E532258|nr:hypothetical protein [Vibrio lentus]MCC4839584.1 hypothetical protein [Vibrio lentus]
MQIKEKLLALTTTKEDTLQFCLDIALNEYSNFSPEENPSSLASTSRPIRERYFRSTKSIHRLRSGITIAKYFSIDIKDPKTNFVYVFSNCERGAYDDLMLYLRMRSMVLSDIKFELSHLNYKLLSNARRKNSCFKTLANAHRSVVNQQIKIEDLEASKSMRLLDINTYYEGKTKGAIKHLRSMSISMEEYSFLLDRFNNASLADIIDLKVSNYLELYLYLSNVQPDSFFGMPPNVYVIHQN